MKWLIFILLIPNAKADALLDAMIESWNVESESTESYEAQSDAEVYHWELGTPDNVPEIEIIYDQTGCYCD